MQRLRVDEGRIVAGIADGPGGRPLQFQHEERLVAHPAGATQHALDGRVDRFHDPEADAMVAVGGDAVDMHEEEVAEALHLGQALPAQRLHPAEEEVQHARPGLRSKDGRHVVIRPLAFVKETDLAQYAELRGFPIIPCDLCGSQEDLKRKKVKTFLQQWERASPGCSDSIAAAVANVAPALLMDSRLFDFKSLTATVENHAEGDVWLDEEPTTPYQM